MPTRTPRPAALDALAREVFSLFPRCVRCGERVARFEEADVRIFSFRVLHREECARHQPAAGGG